MGLKPGDVHLPPPSPRAMRRGAELMHALLDHTKPPDIPEPAPRSYPLARSKVAPAVEAQPEPSPPLSSPPPLPERPPPGAPTVRPSPRRVAHPSFSQEELERTAEGVLVGLDPDGVASFEIAFDEDLFGPMSCKLTLHEGRVRATFLVPNADTRRLVEAEVGILRARLEDRGLRVDELHVAEDTP